MQMCILKKNAMISFVFWHDLWFLHCAKKQRPWISMFAFSKVKKGLFFSIFLRSYYQLKGAFSQSHNDTAFEKWKMWYSRRPKHGKAEISITVMHTDWGKPLPRSQGSKVKKEGKRLFARTGRPALQPCTNSCCHHESVPHPCHFREQVAFNLKNFLGTSCSVLLCQHHLSPKERWGRTPNRSTLSTFTSYLVFLANAFSVWTPTARPSLNAAVG